MNVSSGFLTAVLTLAVGASMLVPASPAAADPEPVDAAADWLVGELEEDDGILVYQDAINLEDVTAPGLSTEAAETLEAIGGHGATVDLVVDAIVDDLAGRPGDVLTPGERAWYLGFLGPRVPDPRDVAGRDLVAELEAVVAADGRIADDATSEHGAAQVSWQADAVRALRAVDSPEYAAARDYLVDQQCPRGPFGSALAPSGGAVSCSGRPAYAVTIDAARALVPALPEDPAAAAAVRRTTTWLMGRQSVDGAVEDGSLEADPIYGVSGRYTGRAVTLWSEVLAHEQLPGLASAVARGAAWVRSLQHDEVGSCVVDEEDRADLGAIGDESYLAEEQAMAAGSEDWYLHGTVASLAALRHVRGRTGPLSVEPPARRYVSAGFSAYPAPIVKVPGAAPGERLCVVGGGDAVTRPVLRGGLVLPVSGRTRTLRYRIEDDERVIGTVTIRVLGELKLKPRVRETVPTGAKQRVRVAGLAPWEKVTVRRGKRVVVAGKADRKGRFERTYRVGRKPGKVTLRVQGEFDDRTGMASYRVTR